MHAAVIFISIQFSFYLNTVFRGTWRQRNSCEELSETKRTPKKSRVAICWRTRPQVVYTGGITILMFLRNGSRVRAGETIVLLSKRLFTRVREKLIKFRELYVRKDFPSFLKLSLKGTPVNTLSSSSIEKRLNSMREVFFITYRDTFYSRFKSENSETRWASETKAIAVRQIAWHWWLTYCELFTR